MRSKERIADALWYGSLSGLMNDRVDSDDFADFSKELSTELDGYAKEAAVEFVKELLRNHCFMVNHKGVVVLDGDPNLFFYQFTNKNKSPMTREQEPKDVKPEEHGKQTVSKPTVDEPTVPSPNGTDGTDSENPPVPRPPLPPQP